jgi:hypothetical protein
MENRWVITSHGNCAMTCTRIWILYRKWFCHCEKKVCQDVPPDEFSSDNDTKIALWLSNHQFYWEISGDVSRHWSPVLSKCPKQSSRKDAENTQKFCHYQDKIKKRTSVDSAAQPKTARICILQQICEIKEHFHSLGPFPFVNKKVAVRRLQEILPLSFRLPLAHSVWTHHLAQRGIWVSSKLPQRVQIICFRPEQKLTLAHQLSETGFSSYHIEFMTICCRPEQKWKSALPQKDIIGPWRQ